MNQCECSLNTAVAQRGQETCRAAIPLDVVVDELKKQNLCQPIDDGANAVATMLHFRVNHRDSGPDASSWLKHREMHHLR